MNSIRTQPENFRKLRLWAGALLCLAGAASNQWLPIDLVFGISILPGGFFGALAALILPFPLGILGPVMVLLPSLSLWGHPWAIPSAFLEGVLITVLMHKERPDRVIFLDALYWLVVGAPLVFVLYFFVLHMPMESVFAAAAKQGANGVANTFLAVLIRYLFQYSFGSHFGTAKYPRAREYLVLFLNAALIVPLASGVLLFTADQKNRAIERAEMDTEIVLAVLAEEGNGSATGIKTFNLDANRDLLTTTRHSASVFDVDGNLLWSYPQGSPLPMKGADGIPKTEPLHTRGRTYILGTPGETNPMKAWRGSRIHAEATLLGGRLLVVEQVFKAEVDRISFAMTTVFLLFLLWLAVSSAGAYLMGSLLVRPLEQLRVAAETIQTGQHGVVWSDAKVLEIRELRDSLVAMTGSLENRGMELAEAKATAERMMRKSESYLAFMGHELKAPIAALLSSMDEYAFSDLTLMRESLGRLLELINDILDQATAGAGTLHLRSEPFDPGRETALLLEPFAIQARRKGLDFRLEMDFPSGLALLGDPLRYRQILANLVSNAVKYTGQGQVLVRLGCHDLGGRLIVTGSVSDTGIGIASEALEDIWKPFAMATGRFVDGSSSHGLGLSIVRGILEAAGGTISVSSVLGKGSAFFFELPFDRFEADKRTEAILPPGPGGTDTPPNGKAPLAGIRALVADDDQLSRMVIARMIRNWGAQVEEAVDGKEALQRFKGGTFDLILLDERMPGLSGQQCAVEIREVERVGGSPPALLVLASAGIVAQQADSADISLVDAVLAKPLDKKALLDLLVARLAATQRPAGARSAG